MIMMHAENCIAIDVLVAQALARGETDPKYHGLTRPLPPLEAEATHRAIVLSQVAGNVPLYVVHVSARSRRVEQIAAAPRRRAQNVFGETCPQYLYLSLEETARRRPGRSRARSGCARRRCAPAAEAPPGRPVAGAAHERPGRWSPPTTARSA